MEQELLPTEVSELRKLAFETASMLSCNQINPTSETILLDADKMFKWLYGGETNSINHLKKVKDVN